MLFAYILFSHSYSTTSNSSMLNTGNVDNSFVFDLINDENLTDEVVRKALAFVS